MKPGQKWSWTPENDSVNQLSAEDKIKSLTGGYEGLKFKINLN